MCFIYSPVLKYRKTTNIRQSALPPSHTHYKTSLNNENNSNDSLVLNVYKLWVWIIVVYFHHANISWSVGIEPTSGHLKMSRFASLSYPMLEWKHNFIVPHSVTTRHYIDAFRSKSTLTLSTEFAYILHCWLFWFPFPYKQWQTLTNKNMGTPHQNKSS